MAYRRVGQQQREIVAYRRVEHRRLRSISSPTTTAATRAEQFFLFFFSCAQIDLRKARERELATLDEKSTSSGIAEPYARKKFKARTGGEEGATPVTTACPEAGK